MDDKYEEINELTEEDSEKIQIITDFTKNLIEKSVDIDGEFTDIVNDNFLEII
jgi:hypothetical protein